MYNIYKALTGHTCEKEYANDVMSEIVRPKDFAA